MFRRGILCVSGLLAFVVPYLLFGNGALLSQAAWKSWWGGSPSAQATNYPGELGMPGAEGGFAANNPGGSRGTAGGGPKLVGTPVSDLGEVLRFDVSPEWVMGRWSRVSTVLAELDLEGLRVPLVTGTSRDDLAGALTYYFDKQRQVQRITFHGYTGDERKLAALVTQRYHFRPAQSLHAALFLVTWNGRPTSALRASLAGVVRADSPNTRLEVMLEINRPSASYGLSPEFSELLQREQQAGRW